MRVIDTYLPLSELAHISEDVMFALQEMELHWSEKLELKAVASREEGREEGQIEGQVKLLLRLMKAKFGILPQHFVERVEAVQDVELLEKLGLQVLTAKTLRDIELFAKD